MRRDIRIKMLGPYMLLALAFMVCNVTRAQQITTNSMPGTNFSSFHTYKWVVIEGASHPNQIVDQEIKDAVNTQLSSKGLTMVANDPADLYVGYQVAVQQQRQWNAYGMGGLRWGGMGSATSSTINNGTLVVDMYNPATKQLVWTGSAAETLDPSSNQQKNMNNLNKAMKKLFQKYPPQ